MWALGCVLLEMLLKTPIWDLPFDLGTKALEDSNYLARYLNELKIPNDMSEITQLVKKLL